MSLLITSNRSEEYAHNDPTFPINHIPADIGIQQPENYRNHLRDPMKILPNSEIAVQSLRFTTLQVSLSLAVSHQGNIHPKTSATLYK